MPRQEFYPGRRCSHKARARGKRASARTASALTRRRRDADAPRALQSSARASHARHGLLYGKRFMSEHGKCPMGKHPWLATFFVLAFLLVFLAHKLGLL